MKTINEMQNNLNAIAKQLTGLSEDLEILKSTTESVTAATHRDELALIETKAKASPIYNPRLANANESTRQTYMQFLSVMAGSDADRLLFARRIGVGSGSNWDAERLAAERLNIRQTFPVEIIERLEYLRYPLLLDSLIIAHLSGTADNIAITMIAEVADLLGCEDNDVAIVAQLAAAIVQMDKKQFGQIECKEPFLGLSYLIPSKWLERVYVGVFSLDKHEQIVENGWVVKNTRLYKTKPSTYFSLDFTTAPTAGIVTYIPRNKKATSPRAYSVYIINPFDDK